MSVVGWVNRLRVERHLLRYRHEVQKFDTKYDDFRLRTHFLQVFNLFACGTDASTGYGCGWSLQAVWCGLMPIAIPSSAEV